jgi:hypothetical protein
MASGAGAKYSSKKEAFASFGFLLKFKTWQFAATFSVPLLFLVMKRKLSLGSFRVGA